MRRFILAIPFLFLASFSFAFDGREQLIDQQLNCFEQYKTDPGINWNDVCYMGSRKNHSNIVTAALDSIENQPPILSPSSQELLIGSSGVIDKNELNDNKKIQEGLLKVETTFDLTHRWDDLNWSIAPFSGSPNVLSELTWKNIKIIELENSGRLTLDNHFILADWRAGLGWVYRGKNQDSDYLGNDRTFEFSRSNNKSNLGDVYDLSGGGGYQFDLTPMFSMENKERFALKKLFLDLLGGYSYYQTQYFMTDGYQTISDYGFGAPLGPFEGLKSNFQAQWKGPWIGGDLKGEMNRWHGLLRYEYHWLDYYGKANWNLRPDFQHPTSYEQTAKGDGYVLMGSGGYSITPFWSIDLTAKWQHFKATTGTIRFFLADGSSPEERLNESIWKSVALSVGNTFHF